MKKFYTVLVISIFSLNSILIGNSLAIGSSPVEICINKFVQKGNTYDLGADMCNKFTKDSLKCMNFYIKKKWYLTDAARLCNGGGDGSFKCMSSLLIQMPNMPPNWVAQRCFGTKL